MCILCSIFVCKGCSQEHDHTFSFPGPCTTLVKIGETMEMTNKLKLTLRKLEKDFGYFMRNHGRILKFNRDLDLFCRLINTDPFRAGVAMVSYRKKMSREVFYDKLIALLFFAICGVFVALAVCMKLHEWLYTNLAFLIFFSQKGLLQRFPSRIEL